MKLPLSLTIFHVMVSGCAASESARSDVPTEVPIDLPTVELTDSEAKSMGLRMRVEMPAAKDRIVAVSLSEKHLSLARACKAETYLSVVMPDEDRIAVAIDDATGAFNWRRKSEVRIATFGNWRLRYSFVLHSDCDGMSAARYHFTAHP